MRTLLTSPLALLVPVAVLVGCGDDGGLDDTFVATPPEVASLLAAGCDDSLESVYRAATPPSPWSAERRGDVVRCAYERLVTVDEMRAALDGVQDFVDPGTTTAAHKLRIAYWTERLPGEPVLTSAVVYVPENRRGDPSPLLVIGHGSVGLDDRCAPSAEDPIGFDTDWKQLYYSYVGDGWLTIAPDFPGLGTPGLTSWMHSLDEGHAMLDATRAARKLFADGVVGEGNALMGHSNGGHAALSAQALVGGYGAAGTIDTVVVQNPFWLSNGLWGALLTSIGDALINPTFLSLSMMYFAGHLDAWEGSDAAWDAFLPEKRRDAEAMFANGCWREVTGAELGPPSIGASLGREVFLPEYVDGVGLCGLTDECETPLAETWRARWVVDRPAIDPDVPIVYWLGAMDDFLGGDFQQCGLDRMLDQGANLRLCVQPDGTHSSTVSRSAGWTRAHLLATFFDAAEPEPCPGLEVLERPPLCGLPFPNSSDPADP